MPTATRQTGGIVRLKDAGVRPSEIPDKLGGHRCTGYRASGRMAIGWQPGNEHANELQEPKLVLANSVGSMLSGVGGILRPVA